MSCQIHTRVCIYIYIHSETCMEPLFYKSSILRKLVKTSPSIYALHFCSLFLEQHVLLSLLNDSWKRRRCVSSEQFGALVFLSSLFFLTGQIPSYKLSGSLSKYVGAVPLASSVCCSEDHQVNIKTLLENHLYWNSRVEKLEFCMP